MMLPISPPVPVDFWTEKMLDSQPDIHGFLYGLLINPETGLPVKAYVMERGGFMIAIPVANYFMREE